MENSKYGENLKALRVKKGLSQGQMADRLNISQSTYSRMESNPEDYTYSQIGKIAKEHGVPLSEVVPDLSALDEKTRRIIARIGKPNPRAEFLVTPFGKFTYIVIGAVVTNYFYKIVRGFGHAWGMPDTPSFTVFSLTLITSILSLYFLWRRFTRSVR